MSTRLLCPGWPKGPCGREAGTAYTNTYCERCDELRRDHITRAIDKNVLEPTVVETNAPGHVTQAEPSPWLTGRDAADPSITDFLCGVWVKEGGGRKWLIKKWNSGKVKCSFLESKLPAEYLHRLAVDAYCQGLFE